MRDDTHASLARAPDVRFYGLGRLVVELRWHEPPPADAVPEALVQDLWRTQRFDARGLLTTDGSEVQIIDPGYLNRDAGPDFLRARLSIGGSIREGAVEIHTASGFWYDHGHHRDPAYAKVILHVTLEPDVWTGRIVHGDGLHIPEVVLAPLLTTPVRRLLHAFLLRQRHTLPCAGSWPRVEPTVLEPWVSSLGRSRMWERVRALRETYLEHPSIAQMLFERTLVSLGYAKNSTAMLELARRVPLRILHGLSSMDEVHAALFGTSGLLPTPTRLMGADRETVDYVMMVREKFAQIQSDYGLEPMPPASWTFFRLRPSNFPTVRIAQAGALADPAGRGPLSPGGPEHVRGALAEGRPHQALSRLFRRDPGPFWHTHLRFERRARRGFPLMGEQRVHALLLNAVAPVLLFIADQERDEMLEDRVLSMLSQLSPEDDEITRRFASLGSPASHALQTQGLHRLYRDFCTRGLCTRCVVGRSIIASARAESQT